MKPPFKMLPSRMAVLTCDGRHVVTGRASFVWQTYLARRAAGVPGAYRVRRGVKDAPWHDVSCTIEEAERELEAWHRLPGAGRRQVERARRTRAGRERRDLPVG